MPAFTPDSEDTVAPNFGQVEATQAPSIAPPQEAVAPETQSDTAQSFFDGVASISWAGQYAAKGLLNATQGTDFIVSPMLRKAEHAMGFNTTDYKPPVQELVGTKYEKYISNFQLANTQEEFNSTKLWYDTMESFQESAARNPIAATAGMIAAGFADPINLIGLPALPAKLAMAGKLEQTVYNSATAAVVFGGLGAMSGVLQKDNNASMTNEDIMFQTMASAAVGSIVGAGVGYYSATKMANMTKEMNNRMRYGRITPPGPATIITEKVPPKPELVISDKPLKPSMNTYSYTPMDISNTDGKVFYHGSKVRTVPADAFTNTPRSSSNLNNLSDLSIHRSGEMNLLGPGIYTTDSKDIAKGYAGKDGKLHSFTLRKTPKLFDGEGKMPPEVIQAINNNTGLNISKDAKLSYISAIDLYKESLHDNPNATFSDFSSTMEMIHNELVDQGYDGVRHLGGIHTKKPAHNVVMYFHNGAVDNFKDVVDAVPGNMGAQAPKPDAAFQTEQPAAGSLFPDAQFGDQPASSGQDIGNVVKETIPFRPMTKASKFLSKAASGNMNAFRGEGFVALDSDLPTVNRAGQFFMRSEIQLAGEPGDVINAPYFLDKARGKVSESLAKEKFLYNKYSKSSQTVLKNDMFMKEVSITKAKKRIDPTYKSGIPEVNAVVKDHNDITKNINTRLAQARIMDPNDIEHYQTRVWNRTSANKISAQKEKEVALEQWSRDPSRWDSPDEAQAALHERLRTVREGEEPSDLKYLDDVMNGETLGRGGRVNKNRGSAGDAFTKHKDLRFDDDILLKHDLIESNASDLTSAYVMKAEKLIQKRRFLDLNNVQTVDDLLKQAKDEADLAASEFSKTVSDPKEIAKYRAEQDRGVISLKRLIEEHDGIRLEPSPIDPFLDILSTYTTTHMLGGQIISSSTDAFYGVAKLGFQDTFQYGFMPMMKELATWDFTLAKNADKEAKQLGLVIDIMINDGLHALMNGGDSVLAGATRVQKINNTIRNTYSKMTGIEYHDRFNTNWILTTASSKLGNFLDDYKAGNLHPDDLQFLNQMGLAEHHLEGIYNQFKRYAVKGHGVTIPMLSDWPETTANEVLYKQLTEQALQNIVRSVILRPSQAEMPYMMLSSRFGKLWGMFKSFTAAGSHRILIGVGQNKQSWRIPAIMSIISMGAMQSIIKSKIKGEEPDLSIDNLVAQGIARSGVLPLFYDQLLSASPWSGYKGKYGDSNFINTMVGPGLGQSIDLARLLTGVTNHNPTDPTQWKFDEVDQKRALMMFPGSNLFWFQGGLTAAGLRPEHRGRTSSTRKKPRTTRS